MQKKKDWQSFKFLLDSSSRSESRYGEINGCISLIGRILRKLQCFQRDPGKCACFCVSSDVRVFKRMCASMRQGRAHWRSDCCVVAQCWEAGDRAPSLAGIPSRQTVPA